MYNTPLVHFVQLPNPILRLKTCCSRVKFLPNLTQTSIHPNGCLCALDARPPKRPKGAQNGVKRRLVIYICDNVFDRICDNIFDNICDNIFDNICDNVEYGCGALWATAYHSSQSNPTPASNPPTMNYQNNQFGKTIGKFSISIKTPLDIQAVLKIARVQNCPEITIWNST